jgi:hypothetical protein
VGVGKFPKPCLDCGQLTQGGNRCTLHQARVDELAEARRALIKKTLNTYGGDYKRRAKQVRDSAVVCHLCGEGARFGDAWEADHLVAERVWAELYKALNDATPSAFFQVLRDCGALKVIFPEIDALFGVPQPPQHHPEIDTGIHALMVLSQACRLSVL